MDKVNNEAQCVIISDVGAWRGGADDVELILGVVDCITDD